MAKAAWPWSVTDTTLTTWTGIYFFDATENRIGWTAGAGVEWAFTPEWSVKLEYDYYGFGTKSLLFIDTTISRMNAPVNIHQTIQVVTARRQFPRAIRT